MCFITGELCNLDSQNFYTKCLGSLSIVVGLRFCCFALNNLGELDLQIDRYVGA